MANKTFDALTERAVQASDIMVLAGAGTDVTAERATVSAVASVVDSTLGLSTATATAQADATQAISDASAAQAAADAAQAAADGSVQSDGITLPSEDDVADKSITQIVALTQAQYNDIASPVDTTFYVITDGKTPGSYNGQLDTAANGQLTLDAKTISARTLTSFYAEWVDGGSAAGTVDVQINTTSALSSTITLDSSESATATMGASVDAAAGDKIRIVLSDVADVTDFVFVLGFES